MNHFKFSETDRNIYIFEFFNNDMAQRVVQTMLAMDNAGQEPIKLYINSFGGSVVALCSIIDIMGVLKSDVYTIAVGDADSAAAWLLSCGKKRFVSANSRVMIHELASIAVGKTSDLTEQMEEINALNEKLIGILSVNTGKPAAQIKADISKKDLFFSADEAVAYGLADEVLTAQNKELFKLAEAGNDDGWFPQVEFKLSEVPEQLTDVQILRAGDYIHAKYGNFKITKEGLRLFKKNFDDNVRGIELSIETTHDNDAGEVPAEGWYKNLSLRNNDLELWAGVEFTAHGRELVAQKRYKYFSPELAFSYTSETGRKFRNVLLGGTLTNRPFLKGMSPVKLSENKTETKELVMDKDEMIKKLSEEHKIDVIALLDGATAKDAEIKKLSEENTQLQSRTAELEVENKTFIERAEKAEADKTQAEKETAIKTLLDSGKIVKAQIEKISVAFATAQAITDFYADAKPVLNITPNGDGGKEDGKIIEAGLIEKAKRYNLSEEDLKKVEDK